jgi:hypothetical protein
LFHFSIAYIVVVKNGINESYRFVFLSPTRKEIDISPCLHLGIKDGKGPADAMFMDTISRPVPTGNQALVRVRAFGLNRMDLLQREGRYPLPPQAPSTMGVEFSGIIEELADSQNDFKVGDEVFGLAYGGDSAPLNPRIVSKNSS